MNPETGAIPKSRVVKSKRGSNVGTKAKVNTKMATRSLQDDTKEVPQRTESLRKQPLRTDNQMPTRKSKRLSGISMESENGLVNRQIKKPSTVTLSSINETNGVIQVPDNTLPPLTKKKKITEAEIWNEIENGSQNSTNIVNSINDEEINEMLNDSYRRYGVQYNGSPNSSNIPKSTSYIDLTYSLNSYASSTSKAQIPAPVIPKERVPKKIVTIKKAGRIATNSTVRPNIVPLETITLDSTLDDTVITLDDSFSNLEVARKTKSTRAEKKTDTSTVAIASCSSSNYSPTILNNRLECPICLECVPGLQGLQVSSTKCGHLFCRPCIVESLKNSQFCPSCRKAITLKSLLNVYM